MSRADEKGRLAWRRFDFDAWASDDELALCSMAARGFWMELLCVASKNEGYVLIAGKPATPELLARRFNQDLEDVEKWLGELEEHGVFSRANYRGARGVIYSRRMVREFKMSRQNRENGKRGGSPILREHKRNRNPVKAESESEVESERDARESEPRKSGLNGHAIPPEILRLEPEKRGWAICLRTLETRSLMSNGDARKFVGRLKRDHSLSDAELFDVGAAAWRSDAEDVRPYLKATAQRVAEDRRRDRDRADPDVERKWIREWLERPASWRGERGGTPDEPGLCRISAEVLAEFGFPAGGGPRRS